MNLPRYLLLALAVISLPLRAADPSEQFLSAYQTYQQAEKLERSGSNQDALTKYRFVESLLSEISKNNPGWQKPVVDYRLKKTREALDRLQGEGSSTGVTSVVDPGTALPQESVTPTPPPARRGPSITIVPPSGGASQESQSVSQQLSQDATSTSSERSLRRKISELTEQLAQAQDALNSQKTRASDLESAKWVGERSRLENELNVANRTISDLRHDLKARSSWEKDLKDLQRKLDDTVADKLAAEEQYRADSSKAASEREDLVRELSKARDGAQRGDEFGARYSELSSQADALRQEVVRLKASLEEAVNATKQSEARTADLQKQLAKAGATLAESSRKDEELTPLREKVAAMERAEKDLRGELASARHEAESSVNRESAMKVRLQSAEEERRKLSERVQGLAEATAEAVKLRPEAAALGKEVSSLRDELKAAEESVSKSSIVAEEFAAKSMKLAKTHESDSSTMSADLAVLEEEEARLKEKSAAPEPPAELSRRLDGLGREIAALREKITSERLSFAKQSAELDQGVARNEAMLKDLEKRSSEVRARLADDLTKLSTLLVGDTRGMKSAVEGLRRQLEESTRAASESRNRIERIQAESARRGEQLNAREKELAASRAEAKKLRDDLDSTNRKLADLHEKQVKGEDRFRQLEQQLSTLGSAGATDQSAAVKDLQGKLEQRDAQIARLRKRGGTRVEMEQSAEENQLLRGIIERQIKEEARREQARRLVEEELVRLNIRSQTLSEQLGQLAQAPVLLTSAEKALFKGGASLPPEGEGTRIKASVSAPIGRPANQDQAPSKTETNSPSATSPAPAAEASPTPAPSPASPAGTNASDAGVSGASAVPPAANSTATNGPTPPSEMPWEGKFKECLALAKEQFDKQEFLKSEATFKRALELSPDDYFALSNLGVVEFQLNKLKEAEAVLRKASTKSTDSSFALTTLGIVCYRQERLDEAAKVLSRAIAVNDQDYTAHNYLGIVMAASGKGKAGESEIMKAIEINPKYADAHFNLAVIYATGKPPAKMMAKKHYTKALELGSPPDASLEKLIQ
jgi:Tfp pilus assembly protein PilF/DNA repair exonuclease SbcCD ATPase subunit